MSQQDISHLLEEAKTRWLRPGEVCEIIRNYQRFHLKPDPPYKPAGGSLFLFDRKTLRYFRKDGHQWRKKRDGKTIREAHEKLKSGSVDVLHCYYAHGEENENFQRRSYWMLDGHLEHIVLVHYREVNDGGMPEVSDLLSPDAGFHAGGHPSYGSSPSPLGWSEHAPSSEVDDVDSGRAFGASPFEEAFASSFHGMPLMFEDVTFDLHAGRWNSFSVDDVALSQVPQTDLCTFGESEEVGPAATVCGVLARAFRNSDADRPLTADSGRHLGFGDGNEANFAEDDACCARRINGGEQGWGMKREDDGLRRWMKGEMGQVCDEPVMAAKGSVDCCWNSMDPQNVEDLEMSGLSRELHLDFGSPGPWLAQEQLFSIVDYSPDWTYSGGNPQTKVLILGTFLGEALCAEVPWSCMFGEVEVPAEVLSPNALRCYAPYLPPGRVPLYVTRSNRVSCSEIREFEYRPGGASSFAYRTIEEERVSLQTRLARIVLSGGGPNGECADCAATVEGFVSWQDDPRETMIETLLGIRLREWLARMKSREDGKGARSLDEHGQGAIHLAAALGYDWAVKSIVAAGVSPNFRDARGWTALHWAACSGREEMVMTLVTLGSSPSAVADPTVDEPHGRTAADVASSRGHKGISGYLAEADLADQLSTLDLADRFCDQAPAVESDGRGRLGETMWAVQTSAEAAARIRSALGGESMRRWRTSDGATEDEEVACVVSSRLFRGKANDGLRVRAAERIQHKYRGWSGRKEFLKMRRRIVKIQAHVRGHQVRRQYKKFLWSVGIVEKAILRWRRRGRGLRGFRGTDVDGAAGEEYDFLAEARMQKAAGVERALARVQSMARRPEGRVQYMRMVAARGISSSASFPTGADIILNCHRREEQNDAARSDWPAR